LIEKLIDNKKAHDTLIIEKTGHYVLSSYENIEKVFIKIEELLKKHLPIN